MYPQCVHCQSKKRALEIISELAAKQLGLPPQVVFEAILTREKMGSTGIGNGIAIPHGKLEEDTLRAVGVFVQLETPIAFDAIDNQPVDLLFALLVPADQTKTHLHTLSLVAKRLADKTICRRLRSAQSDEELIKLSLKQKAIRMMHNQEMAFTSVVLRRNGTWC
jgi:PTS system nitrogen regulatory IIA component